MSFKLRELNYTIMAMIMESYGLENQHYKTHIDNTTDILRVIKYKVPPPSNNGLQDDTAAAVINTLTPHTDKVGLAILSQLNEEDGLEIQTKQGKWVPINAPKGALTVIIGDALKAWSNGRLHSVRHRVMMRECTERYSCGTFGLPAEGAVIQVPDEFVDKHHPLLYRPFNYEDFYLSFLKNMRDDELEQFAGV